MSWPEPAYPGEGAVAEVDPDVAMQLVTDVPASERLFHMGEVLEMLNSWARPIADAVSAADIEGYVEHMAAGGFVIGRPPRPLAMNLDLFRFDGLTIEELRSAIDFARDHGWFERSE